MAFLDGHGYKARIGGLMESRRAGVGLLIGLVTLVAAEAAATAALVRYRRTAAVHALVGRAHTAPQPKSATISPDGREVWVAGFGRMDVENLEVFDAATLERRAVLSIRGNPVEILFDRAGRRAYVSSFAAARVMEVDVTSRAILRELPAGLDPKMMALSPDERTLYVVNWRSDDVSAVDLASGTVRFEMETGHNPRGIVVLPDGRVLVSSTDADVVHEFGPDGAERRRLRACNFPRDLVLSADSASVHVSCSGLSAVTTYRIADWERTAFATTGRNPRSMDGSPDGRWLAVANFDGRNVTFVDHTGQTTATVTPRRAGRIVGVTVGPGATAPRVYATSWDTRELLAFEAR